MVVSISPERPTINADSRFRPAQPTGSFQSKVSGGSPELGIADEQAGSGVCVAVGVADGVTDVAIAV